MPKDDTEVTEQTAEEGFDEAFGGADDEVSEEEEETTEVSDEEEEEDPDKETEEEIEEEDPENSEEDPDKDEEEPDETEERGKELLEEERLRKDAEAAATKDKDEPGYTPQPVSPALAKSLSTLVTRDLLPDEDIEINGEKYNLKAFYDENPEMSAMVGVGFREGMNRLLQNGQIMTSAQVTEAIDKAVFHAVITSQHRDATKIVNSDAFPEWLEKEATDAEKALFRSKDPQDHVLGLSRFKNRKAAQEVKERAKKKKEASVEKKDKHSDLHKHTARSKAKTGKTTPVDDFDTVFEENAE